MEDKIRVLIVDDYPVVLVGLVTMLKNHDNIEVIGVANNGKKAVDLAVSEKPDVVLMNVIMPEMDGIEATRQIKKKAKDVNILMFTGTGNIDQVTPCLNAGAIGYTMKDATELELLQAIQQVSKGCRKGHTYPGVGGTGNDIQLVLAAETGHRPDDLPLLYHRHRVDNHGDVIDLQFLVDVYPEPNTKTRAARNTIHVGGPATNAAVAAASQLVLPKAHAAEDNTMAILIHTPV